LVLKLGEAGVLHKSCRRLTACWRARLLRVKPFSRFCLIRLGWR
jgi:hypothetical protein